MIRPQVHAAPCGCIGFLWSERTQDAGDFSICRLHFVGRRPHLDRTGSGGDAGQRIDRKLQRDRGDVGSGEFVYRGAGLAISCRWNIGAGYKSLESIEIEKERIVAWAAKHFNTARFEDIGGRRAKRCDVSLQRRGSESFDLELLRTARTGKRDGHGVFVGGKVAVGVDVKLILYVVGKQFGRW